MAHLHTLQDISVQMNPRVWRDPGAMWPPNENGGLVWTWERHLVSQKEKPFLPTLNAVSLLLAARSHPLPTTALV